jgi:hypothetical protein
MKYFVTLVPRPNSHPGQSVPFEGFSTPDEATYFAMSLLNKVALIAPHCYCFTPDRKWHVKVYREGSAVVTKDISNP